MRGKLGAVRRFCYLGGKGADGVTASPTGCDGRGTDTGAGAWRARESECPRALVPKTAPLRPV
jgi:hypothetical protein